MTTRLPVHPVTRFVVFAAGLGPAGWLVWAILTGNLSANPLSDITLETGSWTLRFLCITLAITPLRQITGWHWLVRFRRMMGLYAFFYGTLHFLIYVVADRFAALDFPDGIVAWSTAARLARSVAEDIYKRPFITIGFLAWLVMVPLAITSTQGWIRRLGKRWTRLHRLVYVSAVAGVVHFWWLVKADVSRPTIYGIVVAALLAFRVWRARAKRTSVAPARTAVSRP